jgi:hypothetical protein
MKKILALAVILAAFVIFPSVSSAQKIAIADSELSAISGQYGSSPDSAIVTVTFTDPIAIKGTNLTATSTNFSDFWGNEVDSNAYFGMTDISINDCTFNRSGSVSEQALTVPILDPLYPTTRYKLKVTISNLSLSSHDMGVNQTVKLGTTRALTTPGGTEQILGQSYTGGISATVNGSLQIYARNTTWNP